MFCASIILCVAGLAMEFQRVESTCSCTCDLGKIASGIGQVIGGAGQVIGEGGTLIGGGVDWLTGGCGLGPGVDMCGSATGASDSWNIGGTLSGVEGVVGIDANGLGLGGGGDCENNDAPMVVRPQEVPKPPVAQPGLGPVASPCVYKKTIVKPAVLPKPVCKYPGYAVGGVYGATTTNVFNANNVQTTSTMLGSALPVLEGIGGLLSAKANNIVLNQAAYDNEANLVPADAVSLALALEKVKKNCIIPMEDRLTFGFRKIPEEIPQKVIFKKNIPEEKIFNLNGQIVELKPVKITSQKTLEEEACDDLLDLQEEETGIVGTEAFGSDCHLKTLSLGDIGYGPAKLKKKAFIDLPGVSVVDTGAIGSLLEGAKSAVSGLIGAALGGAMGGDDSGFVPGNVMYKTVPKKSQIVVPPLPEIPPDTNDCQSNEVGEESNAYQVGCGTCCKPCCGIGLHSSSSSSSCSSKKATVLLQKLTGGN